MIEFIQAAPVGKSPRSGFWDGRDANGRDIGGYGTFMIDDYAKPPVDLRAIRVGENVKAYVRQSALAAQVGLRGRDIYAIEAGRMVPANCDWSAVEKLWRDGCAALRGES